MTRRGYGAADRDRGTIGPSGRRSTGDRVVQSKTGPLVQFRDDGPEIEDFKTAVLDGLRATPKTLPCKFFYDKAGSELFDRICVLDEYYPTRTEFALLERHGAELAELIGAGCHVIEFGSGSSTKIRLLLAALERPSAYTAIDISGEHLIEAADALAQAFPEVSVDAICADYTKALEITNFDHTETAPRVGFFPGSTIGNFGPEEARAFLERAADTLGPGAAMVLGVDLKKDESLLIAAYNDRDGVTEAFNKNLLARINRELDGDFDLAAFRHEAPYNREHGRIEMYLVSRQKQTVSVDGHAIAFAAGESIHTENSHKYTIEDFRTLARDAGYRPVAVWTDANAMFSVHFLRVI